MNRIIILMECKLFIQLEVSTRKCLGRTPLDWLVVDFKSNQSNQIYLPTRQAVGFRGMLWTCRTNARFVVDLLHFAWAVDDAKCIVVTRVSVSVCVYVCVCVCLSAAVRPHYSTDPDVTWGRDRGCPLVVHYWADLQSVHGLRCYGKITRTLVTSLRPSRDMTT